MKGIIGTGQEKADRTQTVTLIVVVITAFITTFTGSALNLSIPAVSRQFSISAGAAGWLITGYTLAVAAFSVPTGRLADITSMKKVLSAGILIFTACCGISAASVSFVMLLAARIMQGVGAAMIFSTNVAVLIRAFPSGRRGQVLGYSLASTYTGLSAGPVIGGLMDQYLGWRSIFIMTGILGAAALAAAVKKLPPDTAGKTGRIRASLDIRGNLLYIISIVLVMYGLSEILSGTVPVILTAAGLATGILFVWYELKADDPAVDISLFQENAGYACSNLAALMNYGATFAISYLLSVYLQIVKGYDPGTAGLIMVSQPAVMAVLTPVMGRFSDRFSPFRMSSAGMGFCAAGTFIFIFTGRNTSLAVIMTALAVTGLGFSLFSSPNTNAVMSCVRKEYYGVASSLLATMRSIGHTISMVTVTITVGLYLPDEPLTSSEPEMIIKVMRTTFIIFTAICTAGVFISLKRKSTSQQ